MEVTGSGRKMRMTKRREKWLLWLAGIVLCLMISIGAAVSGRAAGRQVYDDAGLFSESEISELTAATDAAEEETGWDLMLLTVNDSSVVSTQHYAEEKFNEYTENDNGIAFVLDMNARMFYIATAGEAYEYVGDTRLNEFLDDATAYAKDGDYCQAMLAMVEDTVTFYQEGKPDNLSVYDADQGIYRDVSGSNAQVLDLKDILLAIVVGAVVCAGFCLFITGKYRLKFGRYHYNAREHATVNLRRNEDHFVRQYVTRRKIPKDPPKNGGGGNTSTVHQGAGGRTFGGGGRGF